MARTDWFDKDEHDKAIEEAKKGRLVSEYRNMSCQETDAVDALFDRVKRLEACLDAFVYANRLQDINGKTLSAQGQLFPSS